MFVLDGCSRGHFCPVPSDWVFVVMCVFLFNGVGGALFDVFFFSPEVLPLPPHPIGTGLSHAPNMLPPTAMLSPTSTSPSPACVSFPAPDREYTGREEARLQHPCTSQMSLQNTTFAFAVKKATPQVCPSLLHSGSLLTRCKAMTPDVSAKKEDGIQPSVSRCSCQNIPLLCHTPVWLWTRRQLSMEQ
jgi:hypothetical protein